MLPLVLFEVLFPAVPAEPKPLADTVKSRDKTTARAGLPGALLCSEETAEDDDDDEDEDVEEERGEPRGPD